MFNYDVYYEKVLRNWRKENGILDNYDSFYMYGWQLFFSWNLVEQKQRRKKEVKYFNITRTNNSSFYFW